MNRVHVLLKNPGSGDATQVSQHNRHPELLIHDRAQFSEKEIFALRDRVIADRAVLASLGVQIASAGEKASVNKVAISVVSTTAATTSAATAILNQRYGSNAITVGVVKELAKGTDREGAPPFLGGYELNVADPNIVPECTMGFIGYRNAGDFEIITAGHCFDTSTPIYHTVRGSGPQFIAYANVRQLVTNGRYDVESITIPAGNATSQVLANDPQMYQVIGADTYQYAGLNVCKSGSSTEETCFVTTLTHITVGVGFPFGDYNLEDMEQARAICGCGDQVKEGDSGGSVYAYGSTGVFAEGITSAKNVDDTGASLLYFTHIADAERTLNVAVYTGTIECGPGFPC